jgi:predicted O-methyltransferase YrrM
MTGACRATLGIVSQHSPLPVSFTAPMPMVLSDFGRYQLAMLFAECGFTRGAEIGVAAGKYAEQLCHANPGLHLACVDAWETYPGYADHTAVRLVEARQEARRRLASYDCRLVKAMSVEAAKQFRDGSLDFVYLDANHRFECVVADLAAWSPKVRTGGIVAGHDYHVFPQHPHWRVIEAVQSWVQAYDVSPWFLLDYGHRGTRIHSYFWVKE